jgi:hypothetical protein
LDCFLLPHSYSHKFFVKLAILVTHLIKEKANPV